MDVQFRNAIPANTQNTALNVLNNAIVPDSPLDPKIGINSNSIAIGLVPSAIGGRFRAERGGRTYGVFADALGSGGQVSYGVYGEAQEADGDAIHYGVSGFARSGSQNIGVDGFAAQFATGNFTAGVRGTAAAKLNSWAGYFNGAVYAAAGYSQSDENLKTNINPIDNSMDILLQLQPSSYYFNQELTALNLEEGLQYGLIAQQLEEILPRCYYSKPISNR